MLASFGAAQAVRPRKHIITASAAIFLMTTSVVLRFEVPPPGILITGRATHRIPLLIERELNLWLQKKHER
jgi:hypothetical protein